MCTGQKAEVKVDTKKVVLSLCQPLYNTRFHVYLDSYVSPPALFVELKMKK